MGLLGKKKKEPVQETAEELRARLAEIEGLPEPAEAPPVEEPSEEIPGELPPPVEQQVKPKEKKVGEAILETKGSYQLNDADTSLAIEALVGRPELKVYEECMIGQEFARIIQGYNKAKEEELPAANEEQPSK